MPTPVEAGGAISTARWAGVALVIAAILGAVALAVVSPSGGGGIDEDPAILAVASPAPSSSPADGRVPSRQPEITDPSDGVSNEWEIEVTVDVPTEALPRDELILEILSGDKVVETIEGPKPGRVTVPGVRLSPGLNVLTASLRGPGGSGPASEPVRIDLDREAPTLTLVSPEDGTTTTANTIEVAGAADPGTRVTVVVKQGKSKDRQNQTVGPSGAFDLPVSVSRGTSRIVVTARDGAGGRSEPEKVTVQRISAQPVIKLKSPRKIKRSSLPANVRFSVVVQNAAKQPLPGAEVVFTLSFPMEATESHEDVTNDKGAAAWKPRIQRTNADTVSVGIEVTTADGAKAETSAKIKIR